MKLIFDKNSKLIKIGNFANSKEECFQKWIFLQIYKPGMKITLLESKKKEDNVLELAFNV